MKIARVVFAFVALSCALSAQTGPQTTQQAAPAAKAEDVKSLDAIMHAIYDSISGPAGEKRDWQRFRSLFVEGARLIPTVAKRDKSGFTVRVMSADDYASRAQGFFDKEGFFEKEIARRVERWGNIAQVFSTYESRHEANGKPFERGINSFQLLFDGQRWWIVTIYWEGERKDLQIPAEYLKSAK